MTDIILKNFELLDTEIGELKSGYEILIDALVVIFGIHGVDFLPRGSSTRS